MTGAAFGEPVHSARDILADHLSQRGIMTAMLFPVPLHRQPAYAVVQHPDDTSLPGGRGGLSTTSLPADTSLPDRR